MIEDISDADFHEVTHAAGPVLVDFWAAWCGPCRRMHPVLERLAAEMAGRVRIVRLDVAAHPQAAAQEGVLSLPTLILYREGKAIWRWGVLSEERLRSELESHLR